MSVAIAICIGHSRWAGGRRDGGAVSCPPAVNEWEYNVVLGRAVARRLRDVHGIAAEVFAEYLGTGYSGSMHWLAWQLRELGVRLAAELHFNSAEDPAARGHEWLHWEGSAKGRLAAVELHTSMCALRSGIPARGVKQAGPGGRGAAFLRLTHCPAVICEPFFGTNRADWAWAREHAADLARAIAEGLAAALHRL